MYAGVLLLIAGLAGYFRYQMRRIIISASRGFEYDLRNDFFAHLERLPVAFFHQNRTGDLMSRATNDLSSVRMMVGPAVMYLANTLITAVVSIFLMFSIDARLTLIVLAAAAHRVDHGEDVRERDTQDVRGSAGKALRHERRRPGVADRCSGGPRLPAGAGGDRSIPRRQRRLPTAQPPPQPAARGVLSDDVAVSRAQRPACAVARQPGCDEPAYYGRRAGRVQRLPRAARMADDRVRVGDESPGAGDGVVEAHADGDGHRSGGEGRTRGTRPASARGYGGSRQSSP